MSLFFMNSLSRLHSSISYEPYWNIKKKQVEMTTDSDTRRKMKEIMIIMVVMLYIDIL